MAREKKIEEFDVVIIGGGAGGLTAGIYCGRARLKTLLIEKALVGGLATYTNEIENYPGFPEGTSGLGLMELFQKQAKKFGVQFKGTDVKSVDLKGEIKTVETFRTTYKAKTVIIASGGRPRVTGGENEEKFLFDKGISFCATCDAASNTGKNVLIIGSGDAAIEEGMFLTKFANKVYVSVIHDEGKMDCNEIAKAEAMENPKMEFIWNSVVKRFEGDEHLERVVLRNLKTDEEIPVDVPTCFEFIGYLPNTEIFQDQVNINERGYILVNEMKETGVDGVYAVGDVTEKFLKQVSTAVGDGAIAGVAAERFIAESEMVRTQILGRDGVVFVYDASDCDCHDLLADMEIIEEMAGGRFSMTRVDVYKSKGISSKLGIYEFPRLAIVKDGQVTAILKDGFTYESVVNMFVGA
ncbi:FAD-binding protein [Oceanispirochaeta crateris]|jgi:thioredoxin reductase (NADPH)|uniref:FAD-binding protein n=1 Tax=Oceanispirochaeta crateris TaxID=2518645 RepID=A0A5C1QFS0_9SPIO|nr:FAD-dependent oxidoreductase [Oceanispirochaeta crateris]QEN06905.1 FAD-binding protein [Oceanispirochaeta crateris]